MIGNIGKLANSLGAAPLGMLNQVTGGEGVIGVTDALGMTNTKAIERARQLMENNMQAILARYDGLQLPDNEKLQVVLQSPEFAGLLKAEGIPDTVLDQITTDPRLTNDMRTALDNLRKRSTQGLTAEDKLAAEQLSENINLQEMSQRQGLEQEAARRGMTDSGINAASQIAMQQNLANEGRRKALQMASQGSQQRMQATGMLGNLAGQQQAQEFGQQAQVASAKDAIARANAMNRQQVNERNLGAKQQMFDQSANINNQQQLYNAGLEQKRFDNEMNKFGVLTGSQQNIANMYGNQAASQASSDASMFGALAGAAGSILSDKNVKINIENGSQGVRQLLDKLQPYEYDYKPEVVEDSGDLGRQFGVMAQDLEKSDLGSQFVAEDQNGVKRVDYGKMGSTQMAAIADVHQRVSKMEQLLKMLGIDTEEV